MDDAALDIGLRQGLLTDDDIDASFFGEFDDDDEEALALLDETEEYGDDYGGDPDTVNEYIQSEFESLLESVEDADSAVATARELLSLALDTYIERREHLRNWMDEHLDETDLPVWVGEFEDRLDEQ